MSMIQTIVTDTTKECPPQCSTATGTHDDEMRIFFVCHFTDRFSRFATFLLEQLVIKLSEHSNTKLLSGCLILNRTYKMVLNKGKKQPQSQLKVVVTDNLVLTTGTKT